MEDVRWYRLAAEQGLASAQNNLGVMYGSGEGVPENDVTAYAWASLAAAQNTPQAGDLKQTIASQMTRAQIAEAQALAREYWDRYVLPFR